MNFFSSLACLKRKLTNCLFVVAVVIVVVVVVVAVVIVVVIVIILESIVFRCKLNLRMLMRSFNIPNFRKVQQKSCNRSST